MDIRDLLPLYAVEDETGKDVLLDEALEFLHKYEFKEALEDFKLYYAMKVKEAGPEDTNTLYALMMIGTTYAFMNENNKALEYIDKFLEIAPSVLGEDNRNVIHGSYIHAHVAYDINEKIGLPLLQKAYDAAMKALDPDDYLLAMIKGDLGWSYGQAFEHKKAVKLLSASTSQMKAAKGITGYYLFILRSLGIQYYLVGDYDGSIKSMAEWLEFASDNADREDVLSAHFISAVSYECKKENEKALEEFKQCLKYTDEANLPSILDHIADVYDKLNMLKEAVELLEELYTIQMEKQEADDEESAWTLFKIGNISAGLDDFDKGITYMKRSYEVFEKLENPDALKYLSVLEHLAMAYYCNNDHKTSLELYQKCRKLCIEKNVQEILANAEKYIEKITTDCHEKHCS